MQQTGKKEKTGGRIAMTKKLSSYIVA